MLKPALLALLLLLPLPAMAASVAEVDQRIADVLGDPGAFHEAFDAIQQALAEDDAEALAKWVEYPLNVQVSGAPSTIASEEDFVAAYPQLLPDAIKAVVEEQDYADLFVNDQGAMFGNGQMWLGGICKDSACKSVDVRIITIQDTDQ